MELTRRQFAILELLIDNTLSQRQIKERTGMSLGTINRTIKLLSDAGLVSGGAITKAGLNAMEPYRVKRAVFIAAGFGTRLVPITLNTPKPLVRVNGKRIIDGLLDACIRIGIEEICVVRGYLSEQFDQLLYKYPMIRFLENPAYNEANNISSALVARHLLANAYVFEADLLLYNPSILKKYHYTSDFLGFKTPRTDDWCFEVEDGVIREEKVGGEGGNIWQMVGISYWNRADGSRLSRDIEEVYAAPGGKERYWEQVPLVYRKENYAVEICECAGEDVTEIDTFRELKAIDKTYDV